MKKIFLIMVLCCGLVSLPLTANALSGEVKRDAGYISLNASKAVDVEPNLARVTFAVENTAETAQKASSDNNETSNKIINGLKMLTDAKTDVIRTTNFSVRPVYATNKDGKRIIKNYAAVNSITVQTSNIKNVANLIDAAIANGANRTDGLYYSYENENSSCNEMYPQVMESLRKQASSIAQAAGTSLDGIKSINASCSSETAISNGRFYMEKAVMADGTAPLASGSLSTPVEAGKVKVRVYVNVDFYVK